MDKDIEKRLVEIVGKENFAEDLIELVPYAYDASDHDHRPEAVAWPINTQQVSKIPRGSNLMSVRFRPPAPIISIG